ncbi:DUF4159 domain-containing protein [Planctomicrobium sp. SH664]|uniref:DUF4159 domain-containing protein n=1 Tax=Planctomicrobium sp. SH664 TaxID=3448125 RepID=UPI003F5C6B5B
MRIWLVLFTAVFFAADSAEAQFQRGRRPRFPRRDGELGQDFKIDRNGVPTWDVDKEFPRDVFTFVRIKFNGEFGYYGGWQTDYPDSDLNFSFRLQQLTSLKVNPDPIVLELTDPRLFDYPFIYFCEPGRSGLGLTPEETKAFRKYLDNGGFAMFDDFWGDHEYDNFYHDLKKVFPEREAVEIPLEHPIFHIVYDLKEKPQVPSIGVAMSGRTYESSDARNPDYRGVFDDKGRLMVMICHNTDLGDGWEREGENKWYFHEFSEKKAYPMGINIVVYAMSH